LEKKLAIIAVIVVAIVVIAGVAIALWSPGDDGEDEKVIYWIKVAPVDQSAQIAAGLIDGGVSWEPYCSDTILSGNGHSLMETGDLEGWSEHPCCVLAVSTSYAQAHPDLVARVIAAHIEATEWIIETIENKTTNVDNYTTLLAMGAAFSGRNTTVVAASLDNINYLYELNDELNDYLVNFTNEFITLEQVLNSTVTSDGYASVEDYVDTLVNDSYMTTSETLNKSASILGTVRLGYLNGDLHQFARIVASNETLWGNATGSLFEQWGVEITGTVYGNGADEMTGFSTGLIDMGYLGAPPVILKSLNLNYKITIVSQANTEGSSLIVSNDITSIADLDGKTIATPGVGSIQHLWLMAFAEKYGFELKAPGT
jgi:NitT/TauT family transport system substrate-binding protein